MYEEKIIPPKKAMPQAQDGTLRKFALRVPEVIYQCSGIIVFGKRIKSLVFSTDLSIIKNVNADAIIAVYPFTPQPIITQALLLAADIPVFAGVGGGLTKGQRVVNLAMFAEMQGATGVVLNAPTANAVVQHVAETIVSFRKERDVFLGVFRKLFVFMDTADIAFPSRKGLHDRFASFQFYCGRKIFDFFSVQLVADTYRDLI